MQFNCAEGLHFSLYMYLLWSVTHLLSEKSLGGPLSLYPGISLEPLTPKVYQVHVHVGSVYMEKAVLQYWGRRCFQPILPVQILLDVQYVLHSPHSPY